MQQKDFAGTIRQAGTVHILDFPKTHVLTRLCRELLTIIDRYLWNQCLLTCYCDFVEILFITAFVNSLVVEDPAV